MKKLFLLIILFSSFVFGQDLQYANHLNNLDYEQIKIVSDEIIAGFRGELKFIKSQNTKEGDITMIYYKSDITDKTIEEDLKFGYCNLCTEVVFKKYYNGSNRDLEITGQEQFNFVSVEGRYLDLYQWWIKHFAPTQTKESLLESKERYIQNYNPNVNIRFTKDGDIWEILNIR